MARTIDGRAVAAQINEASEQAWQAFAGSSPAAPERPSLAILVPIPDEATLWYVRTLERACAKAAIACRTEQLDPRADAGTARRRIIERLDAWSADPAIHAIICQTPLPRGVSRDEVGAHITPAKDVDGANPVSLGRLAAGLPAFAPATAEAVVELLDRERVQLDGANVVVVGRSTVVGKPAALLLLARNATVTVAHSRTRDLAAVCGRADVLVAAVGRAHLIKREHVREGAIVIDVGTNPTEDGTGVTGDVAPEAAQHATAITPVPGGVGPVTTALLLAHTVQAAIRQSAAASEDSAPPRGPSATEGANSCAT